MSPDVFPLFSLSLQTVEAQLTRETFWRDAASSEAIRGLQAEIEALREDRNRLDAALAVAHRRGEGANATKIEIAADAEPYAAVAAQVQVSLLDGAARAPPRVAAHASPLEPASMPSTQHGEEERAHKAMGVAMATVQGLPPSNVSASA